MHFISGSVPKLRLKWPRGRSIPKPSQRIINLLNYTSIMPNMGSDLRP